MASPRRLEIPQRLLDESSMIPYSQSSTKNGGKAKARNALLMWNRLKSIRHAVKCFGIKCLPKGNQNNRGEKWDKTNKQRIEERPPWDTGRYIPNPIGVDAMLNNRLHPNPFGSRFHVPRPPLTPERIAKLREMERLQRLENIRQYQKLAKDSNGRFQFPF